MELWTAFLLGIVGSLHCAVMCGPLALAIPGTGRSRASFVMGRVIYNLGRIATYGVLGVAFGAIGQTLSAAGLQRWVSLIAGIAVIATWIASPRLRLELPITKAVVWIKAGFARMFLRRTLGSLFVLGLLNGLLPCGLVYVAGVAASASGNLFSSVAFMVAFGAGTVPSLLAIAVAARPLQSAMRSNFQRLVPASILLVGLLLVLRGLDLGIPYLSPRLGNQTQNSAESCH